MTTKRVSAPLAIAAVLATTSGILAMPVAHADPLSAIRAEVLAVRALSSCGPLNYNYDLEGAAQDRVGNSASTAPRGGYEGIIVTAEPVGVGDPESRAITNAVDHAVGYIDECKFKDFGVGFIRNEDEEKDTVAIVFGQPAAPPPVVQVPDPAKQDPPKQDPPPPPVEKKPLEGPTVSSRGGFGGVTITFTDRSGVPGQCTYKSDVDNKTFPLRANSSADVDVQGRRSGEDSRPGTVTCNNGTSADATINF